MKNSDTKKIVREGYANIAKESTSCCAPKQGCGCGSSTAESISKNIGYSDQEMASVPDGANLGLGCGNPTALASLKEGETVLDLGSGAGFDAFLSAAKVGKSGRVIGVDMTHEMLEKARHNAEKGGYSNVEFRLGEIEYLPVSDNSIDCIISNCVINLSPDKPQVFSEAFRVLKPGGRLMVSDIVIIRELPEELKSSVAAIVGCVSGALKREDYLKTIQAAGFEDVEVFGENFFQIDTMLNDPTAKEIINKLGDSAEKLDELNHSVSSIRVKGLKPL